MSSVNGSALERVSSCNSHSPSMKPCVITSLLLVRKLEDTEAKQRAQEDRARVPELTQTPASVPFASLSDQNQPVKTGPEKKCHGLEELCAATPPAPTPRRPPGSGIQTQPFLQLLNRYWVFPA